MITPQRQAAGWPLKPTLMSSSRRPISEMFGMRRSGPGMRKRPGVVERLLMSRAVMSMYLLALQSLACHRMIPGMMRDPYAVFAPQRILCSPTLQFPLFIERHNSIFEQIDCSSQCPMTVFGVVAAYYFADIQAPELPSPCPLSRQYPQPAVHSAASANFLSEGQLHYASDIRWLLHPLPTVIRSAILYSR